MPNFKEYMNGKLANGEEIPARENPFYHIRKTGQTQWQNSNRTLWLKDTVTRRQGTLEFIVRQGHYVKVELESEEAGYFQGKNLGFMAEDYEEYSYDADGMRQDIPDHRITQFEKGGNSFLQLDMYGGSALAISSEELQHISDTIPTEYNTGKLHGIGVRDISTYIYLAPHPPMLIAGQMTSDPVQARSFKFTDFDDNVFVRLLEVGITEGPDGQTYESAANSATSNNSQNNTGGTQVGSRYTVDDLQTTRFGSGDDPEGRAFNVSIVHDPTDMAWWVTINGVRWSPDSNSDPYYSESEADTEAARLLAYFKANDLPEILRKEVQQATEPPQEIKIGGIDWSFNNPFMLYGSILLGTVAIGLLGYIFIKSLGTTAGERVANAV